MVIFLATLSSKMKNGYYRRALINSLDPVRYRVCNINKLQYNNSLQVYLIESVLLK